MLALDLVHHPAHHPLEGAVDGQGTLYKSVPGRGGPDLHSPALVGRALEGDFLGAVEVDHEASAAGDDVGRNVTDRLAGERVLLAQTTGLAMRHQNGSASCRDSICQAM